MQQEAPAFPPTASPSAFNVSNGFRVAIYAPRAPRFYLGARVLRWSGASTWACEPSVFDAWEFGSVDDAIEGATEVLGTFEWNTPAARDRIVEVLDASGVTIRKIGMRANGVGALRLM